MKNIDQVQKSFYSLRKKPKIIEPLLVSKKIILWGESKNGSVVPKNPWFALAAAQKKNLDHEDRDLSMSLYTSARTYFLENS